MVLKVEKGTLNASELRQKLVEAFATIGDSDARRKDALRHGLDPSVFDGEFRPVVTDPTEGSHFLAEWRSSVSVAVDLHALYLEFLLDHVREHHGTRTVGPLV